MTREQLEHAIRAACDVSGDTELFIFGSQAILGEHPDAPPALRGSIEVDLQPVNHPEAVDAIDGALGESHDLAASKLHAYRPKDRDFVRTLLVEGLVVADVLLGRVDALAIDDEGKERLRTWIRVTAQDV